MCAYVVQELDRTHDACRVHDSTRSSVEDDLHGQGKMSSGLEVIGDQ